MNRVPNIKFNVAKVLQLLIPIVDQSVSSSFTRLCYSMPIFDPSGALRFHLTLLKSLLQVVEKTIRPCLVELGEDPDVDVRYFAGQALQACDQVMMSS